MNQQGHNNIRNGIVWVQTGHRPQHKHMYSHIACDWTPNTPKIRIVQEKFPRRRKSNSNLLIHSKNPRSFESISGGKVKSKVVSRAVWRRASPLSPDKLSMGQHVDTSPAAEWRHWCARAWAALISGASSAADLTFETGTSVFPFHRRATRFQCWSCSQPGQSRYVLFPLCFSWPVCQGHKGWRKPSTSITVVVS